uniref:NADH-quinone oxidoreductase subunit D domain-containing protein n=1 Tax=Salix viminalis TaxID=40686 RepID=A0A6N2NC85_SALVM
MEKSIEEPPMNVPATRKDFMIVNMGPHHPSMHGVLRLILSLDGEDVIDCEPILDIGADPFFYIFRERELIYDLFEAATGMRMMHNYFRIGGVAADLPHGWTNATSFRSTMDLRKVDHYECYDEFDWGVQWQKEGDSLARYLVRIGEMTESVKIIQQALEGIPGGPYEI